MEVLCSVLMEDELTMGEKYECARLREGAQKNQWPEFRHFSTERMVKSRDGEKAHRGMPILAGASFQNSRDVMQSRNSRPTRVDN